MSFKHVQESLGQFSDWQYFSVLESKKEEKVEEEKEDKKEGKKLEESGDDKFKEEDEAQGLEIIDKLRDNLERFVSASGGKIIKYKEFWDENKTAVDGFDENGDLYKMFDSDYVAGVLTLPDEALSSDELDAEIKDVDDDTKDKDEDSDDDSDDDSGDADDKGDSDSDEDNDSDDDEAEKDEDNDSDDESEEKDELEEGNAFGGALKKAKDKGKKDFKVGKKKFKVKESMLPIGEKFALNEEENPELGFNPGGEEKEEDKDIEKSGDESEENSEDDGVIVDDKAGAAIVDENPIEDAEEGLDGVEGEEGADLDIEGSESDDMKFDSEGESKEFFVVFNMNGKDREEIFRTDSVAVIEKFREFFQNEFKGSIKQQIQAFKEAQLEKKREEEERAKEEIRNARKGKIDTFLKE